MEAANHDKNTRAEVRKHEFWGFRLILEHSRWFTESKLLRGGIGRHVVRAYANR